MRTLTKKCNVSLSTVSRAVNKHLNMTSYVQRYCHLLTAKAKAFRAKRSPNFLSFIKYQEKALVFVDEKKFTVDTEVNHKNSHVIAYDPSDIPPMFQIKNHASLMLFSTMASDGSITKPHFIVAGLKIGTKEYLDILKTSLLWWMEQNFGLDNVVLIQDSGSSHT